MREAITLGFDRSSWSWITGDSRRAVEEVPPLDGALLIDEAALNAGAEDFGHLQHQRPIAVLQPGSSEDIVRMVNFAREQGMKIGPRGAGHSTFGQSQVEGGIVIQMTALQTPPVFGPERVEVGAGMSLGDVLAATLQHEQRPPVLTNNLALSVGGPLAVGGIDGGSYRHGALVDNVIEMQVVTGEGRLETCSATQLPELFEALLAGRGQCGIVVRATLQLIPAHTHVLFSQLLYRHLPPMLDDLRALIADGRFDRVSAYALPSSNGWSYYLQGATNFTPPARPDEEDLFAGLGHLDGFERVTTPSYFDYADRGRRYINWLTAQGRINRPHPWLDLYVPDSGLDEFAAELFANLDLALLEPDFPIEFYGGRAGRLFDRRSYHLFRPGRCGANGRSKPQAL